VPKLLKAIAISSIAAITLGIIGYFIIVFWLIAQGSSGSNEMVDTIRSKQAMYWSLPFTLVCLVISVYFATRELLSGHYLVALGTAILVGLSIYIGPLKIISIHMNLLPVAIGALIGAFLSTKLNKSLKSGTLQSGAP